MTIKVEQEVLLRVLEPRGSHSSLDSSIEEDDEYLLVDFRKPISSSSAGDNCSVGKIRTDTYDSDDDDSIFTLSTASLSDSDSVECGSTIERRVSFAEDLVTDEWTRPYTPRDLIPVLYYSTEETTRFRQEYRLERKLLSDFSLDPDTMAYPEDLSSGLTNFTMTPPSATTPTPLLASSNKASSGSLAAACANRHRISRVVVLHNDKLETFFDDAGGSWSPMKEPISTCSEASSAPSSSFFDNDSFWSGSITWY